MHCYPQILIYFHTFEHEKGFSSWAIYNKSLKDRSLGKQLILFASNLKVTRSGRFSGNKIICFLREQSLSFY